jgi:CMP-N,N'-diacetyllegionaminic acid synthase
MYEGKRIVAFVPARGGSKRLPGKNIRLLAGKPLIVHSIEHGLHSRYIDEVYLTSNDDEILRIGGEAGAKLIKRPDEFATDTASSLDAMKHAVNYVEAQTGKIDLVVLLQPTTPLRKVATVDAGIKRLVDNNADSAIGVVKRHLAANWIFRNDGEYLSFVLPNDFGVIRSQDKQENHYDITGGFYAYNRDILMAAEKYALGKKIVSVVMGKDEIADIDDIDDFNAADALLRSRQK